MNKPQLIIEFAKELKITIPEARKQYNALMRVIAEKLIEGDNIPLEGVGKLCVVPCNYKNKYTTRVILKHSPTHKKKVHEVYTQALDLNEGFKDAAYNFQE